MKFYSTKEVAEMSGKSPSTIRKHIANGTLKAKKINRVYIISETDYLEWINTSDTSKCNTIPECNATLERNVTSICMYSIREVAEMSGKSQKTIRRHIASGSLRAKKVNNQAYRISRTDYLEWINTNDTPECNVEEQLCLNIACNTNDANNIDHNANDVNYIDISDVWNRNYWENPQDSNGLNFIDLFAGAGGLSLGFVMAGYTPIASVEINEFAVKTYKHNFIEKRGFDEFIQTRDIKEQSVKQELYDIVGDREIDVICGGFPCQGFSMAGNRIVTDERNSLYREMLDIVRHIRPKFVVMENVVGLRSMLDGRIERQIIEDYTNAGYRVNVTVLTAADYEVPQLRRRVIFICNRENKTNYHPMPLITPNNYKTTRDAIEDLMDLPNDRDFNHVRTMHQGDMPERLAAVPEGASLYPNYSDSWKKCPWEAPSCTVKENHGAVNIHPRRPRVITAREMARLQSFPDDFIFQGAKKWQLVQLGNAVPPLLGKAIGLAVEKSLNSND